MITHPTYSSHAEQQAHLGCAAILDPARHPRRYALQQARTKREREYVRALNQPEEHTIQMARQALTDKQAEERQALAERAYWYSDLTMTQAAKALGISRDKLQKLKSEFDLQFVPGYRNQHSKPKQGA